MTPIQHNVQKAIAGAESSLNKVVGNLTDPNQQQKIQAGASQLFANLNSWYTQKKKEWTAPRSQYGQQPVPTSEDSDQALDSTTLDEDEDEAAVLVSVAKDDNQTPDPPAQDEAKTNHTPQDNAQKEKNEERSELGSARKEEVNDVSDSASQQAVVEQPQSTSEGEGMKGTSSMGTVEEGQKVPPTSKEETKETSSPSKDDEGKVFMLPPE
ncbi:hypothetical protein HK102_004157 [Quaeritorhiza haematococci]|nr:hypothetical protein HK102_004157 [Quaeritorhiza haematococci]